MVLENANDFMSILILIGFMTILIILIKWVAGDFSPVTIEKLSEREVDIFNNNDEVIGKKLLIDYKYTYRDNSVKYKTKQFKL